VREAARSVRQCRTCLGTGAIIAGGDIDACPVCARYAEAAWRESRDGREAEPKRAAA
jgi:hypothetical protein